MMKLNDVEKKFLISVAVIFILTGVSLMCEFYFGVLLTNEWRCAITLILISIFVWALIEIKGLSVIKTSAYLICVVGIIIIYRPFFFNQGTEFMGWMKSLGGRKLIIYIGAIVTGILLLCLMIRHYKKVFYIIGFLLRKIKNWVERGIRFFVKFLVKVRKTIRALLNFIIHIVIYIITYIKNWYKDKRNKKHRYIVTLIFGALVGFAINKIIFANFTTKRMLGVYIICELIALIIALVCNEDVSKVREHPYRMSVTGWSVFSLIYLYLLKIWKNNNNIVFDFETVTVYLILLVAWLVMVFAVCKIERFRDQCMMIGLLSAFVILIVEIQLCAAFPVNKKQIIISTMSILPMFYFGVLSAFSIMRHKVKDIWNTYLKNFFKNNVGAASAIISIFIWSICFTLICIVRWTMFESEYSFISALIECGLYSVISILCIITVAATVQIVNYVIQIFSEPKNNKSSLGIVFWMFSVSIVVVVEFGLKGFNIDLWNTFLKQASEIQKSLLQIIIFSDKILLLVYIFIFFIFNSLSKSTSDWINVFIHNKALTYVMDDFVSNDSKKKEYLEKILPEINLIVKELYKNAENISTVDFQKFLSDDKLTDEQKKIIKVLQCSDNYRGVKINGEEESIEYLPKSMSSFFALNVASAIFKICDIFKDPMEWFKESSVGSVMHEFISLFFGEDDKDSPEEDTEVE